MIPASHLKLVATGQDKAVPEWLAGATNRYGAGATALIRSTLESAEAACADRRLAKASSRAPALPPK